MDQTAQVRVKARRAECQAAGSAHLDSIHTCMQGGNLASTWSSSSERRLPCAHTHAHVDFHPYRTPHSWVQGVYTPLNGPARREGMTEKLHRLLAALHFPGGGSPLVSHPLWPRQRAVRGCPRQVCMQRS